MKNNFFKTAKSNLLKALATGLLLVCLSVTFAFEANAGWKFWERSEIEKCRTLYSRKTPKSWEQAYESTCSELARNGNGEAQYYIGMIIKNSPKIPDYKAQAYSFFYVANENGEERAKGEMEKMKLNNREMERVYHAIRNIYNSSITTSSMTKKDDKKSLEFLGKSANFGNRLSQSAFASAYALGFSDKYKFSPDLIQAYKWSYLSIQDNIGFFPDSIKDVETEKQTAKKVFDKIEYMCDKSQIQQGQKLAKEWIKNNPDLVNKITDSSKDFSQPNINQTN